MKGLLLSKTLWSLCALFGASCAVGIPLSLTRTGNQSGSESVGTQTSVSARDGRQSVEVSLSKCTGLGDTDHSTTTSFGEDKGKAICWKVETPTGVDSISTTVETSLTQLFKDRWKDGVTNWESADPRSPWKSKCLNHTYHKWAVIVSENTGQVLGYCNNPSDSSSNQTSFFDINKDRAQNKVLKISFCNSNCFTTQESSGIEQLETKNNDNWKEINFYSKS